MGKVSIKLNEISVEILKKMSKKEKEKNLLIIRDADLKQ